MTLEDKRDKKRKRERILTNTFILTDAKKIKLKIIQSNLKKQWGWDIIPALKIFSMI